MGPQSDPLRVVNVGVAAHITGAARGGPRFDLNMSEKERRSSSNGIWLCQNCAKKIDSDVEAYPAGLLQAWKAGAEEEARNRIGKTDSRTRVRSRKQAVEALKRDKNIRDDLYRDLLKTSSDRIRLTQGASRASKFLHSEIVIHRIGDTSYPEPDESPGISGWFKLEILDFYHGGLECILDLKYALLDSRTRTWSLLSYEQSKEPFPPRFSMAKVYLTGKIPWRNILFCDMRGDQHHAEPHLYCEFAESGMPYEGWGFFLATNGYESELRSEDKLELEALTESAEFPAPTRTSRPSA